MMSAYESSTVPIVCKRMEQRCETTEGWSETPPDVTAGLAAAAAAAEVGHLGKSFHVVADDLGIRTLQLADDFEALVELGEDVHHGAGEQSVLRRHLELESQKKRARRPVGEALETGGGGGNTCT